MGTANASPIQAPGLYIFQVWHAKATCCCNRSWVEGRRGGGNGEVRIGSSAICPSPPRFFFLIGFSQSSDRLNLSESKNSYSRRDKSEKDQARFDSRKIRVSEDGVPGAVLASFID